MKAPRFHRTFQKPFLYGILAFFGATLAGGMGSACTPSEAHPAAAQDTSIQVLRESVMGPIHYDETVYPPATTPEDARLGGVVDARELPSLRGTWTGLFHDGRTYSIRSAPLKITRVPPGRINATPDPTTGKTPRYWEVKPRSKDSTVLLIRNKRPWKPGPVEALPVAGMKLYPGDSVYWDHGNHTYLVYAEGGIRRNRKGVPQEVWNYKLWVTSTVSGVAKKSLLVATPRVPDGPPVFRFAGDVDNDGLLDWILTTSEYTLPTTWVWYLSKEATGRELVVPAAQYRAVGC